MINDSLLLEVDTINRKTAVNHNRHSTYNLLSKFNLKHKVYSNKLQTN